MSTPTATEQLAAGRHAITVIALELLAALSADPAPALDALAAIAPAEAALLCEHLADRAGSTAAAGKAEADRYRIGRLAASRPAPAGGVA